MAISWSGLILANSKQGGVCMSYKNCLPLKFLDIRLLHESIAFELRISDKLCSFISFFRSPNQLYDDFVYDSFIVFMFIV